MTLSEKREGKEGKKRKVESGIRDKRETEERRKDRSWGQRAACHWGEEQGPPARAPSTAQSGWVIKGKKNEPLSLQSRARVISRRY